MNTRRRQSTRLPRFDYTRQGAYFVTLCTRNRACLFGDIVNGEMRLNDIGNLADGLWQEIPVHFPQAEIDAWIVMPNHVHGVIVIADPHVGATQRFPWRHRRRIQTAVSKHLNRPGHPCGLPIWQRNYYDHVIRDDAALDLIRQYIADNPARWDEDPENPARQLGKE